MKTEIEIKDRIERIDSLVKNFRVGLEESITCHDYKDAGVCTQLIKIYTKERMALEWVLQ